jgi:serine/threonine protein kinase
LAGFVLARIDREFTIPGLDNFKGTTFWMSPEMVNPKSFDREKVRPTMESDAYSFGMVIYEVCMIFAVSLLHPR